MAETWDKLFRQVVLRGGLLKAPDSTTLQTYYVTPDIGQTQMDDRAVEFPKESIDDALLMAGDRIIRVIAANPTSPYRRQFADTTAAISSGSQVPAFGAGGSQVIGVVGDVRDAADSKICERLDSRDEVEAIRALSLKVPPYYYWTDTLRIVHTRTTVRLDVVVWDKDLQRTALDSSPTRGECPFTEDLHETLIHGALATLFRSTFNADQVKFWADYFEARLDEITKMGVVQTVAI